MPAPPVARAFCSEPSCASTGPKLPLLAAFSVWLGLALTASAQLTAQLTTRHLARGEEAFLEIILPERPTEFLPAPVIPSIPEVAIRATAPSAIPRQIEGRRVEYFFQYAIQSYDVGLHTIPPVQMVLNGFKTRTEPIEFVVFDPAELQWSEIAVAGRMMRYAAGFRILKASPYEGESVPAELKLYVPQEVAMTVEDWGIPELERDGVACWRMQPSSMKGKLNVLSHQYTAVAYPTVLRATRSGKVVLGPAKLRLSSTQLIVDRVLQRFTVETFLQIPKLEFETTPLPPGAPAGFANAIGSFTLSANASETEVREGDPISVELMVTGSGNLDTLRPPQLQEAKEWKIYEATTAQRGDERRNHSGFVIFQQLIKPLKKQGVIPPFRLDYFDPVLKQYRTLKTAPIPLKILPVSTTAAAVAPLGPPPSLAVPVERMTDILAVLRPAQLLTSGSPALPNWLGHALAGLLAAGLLARAFWLRLAPRLRKNPVKIAEQQALAELSRTPAADDVSFLKQAGAFIERWLGEDPSPELQAVLRERDSLCYLAEKPSAALGKRRRDILKLLRQAIHPCLVFAALTLFATPTARAADSVADRATAAYDAGRFDEALALWLEAGDYDRLAPDTLYNIGNACYRLGSPGHAALYYRRALVRNPGHSESRQNLRFIERKCGAITIHRPDYQYVLARVPLGLWQGGVWAGAWLCGLGLLVFPATRRGARIRVAAICVLVIGPLLAAGGYLGWHYYPNDAEFAPYSAQAVIVAEQVVVRSDASRTSPEIIDAPVGSLCEIIHFAGDWAYISFATQTRGWVPVSALEKVVPTTPPGVPKIRKPTANERTA
jgi:tetratricopeptide (TPR) repeat protein